jgi:hypothetical protein
VLELDQHALLLVRERGHVNCKLCESCYRLLGGGFRLCGSGLLSAKLGLEVCRVLGDGR